MHVLRELCAYEARHPRAPDFYTVKPVHWVVRLRPDGRLLDWGKAVPPAGAKFLTMLVPEVNRGSSALAFLLSDKAEYALGLHDADRADKARAYHELFVKIAEAAEDHVTPETAEKVRTVLAFLADKKRPKPPAEMTPNDRVVFEVGGTILTDLPDVQRAWADAQHSRTADGQVMPCGCCGETRPTVSKVPEWVRGLPEALQGKCTPLSANDPAAWRWGRKQTLGACLCPACALGAVRALNRLGKAPDTLTLGHTLVAAWSNDGRPVPLRGVLQNEAGAVMPDAGQVHVLVFRARQSRLVVLDFWTHDAAALKTALRRWHDSQTAGDDFEAVVPMPLVTRWETTGTKKTPVRGLLNLLHPNGDVSGLAPQTAVDVIRSATRGVPLPWEIRAAALSAIGRVAVSRLDPQFGPDAKALLNLADAYRPEGDMTNKTIPIHDTPAYRCGELLATLKRIQQAAVPGIVRTVAESALRTTQTDPPGVLGRALTDAGNHLASLTKKYRGAAYEQELKDCLQGLDIPVRFNSAEQAAFVIGFYQASGRAKPALIPAAPEPEPAAV